MSGRQVQPHEAGEHPYRFQPKHVCRHCLRPVGDKHQETCCLAAGTDEERDDE